MNFGTLSIQTANNIAHEQLAPIPPIALFSSPYIINKPVWCVKPRNLVKLSDISSGNTIDVDDFHIIGRGEKSTIVIESLFVSRCHAALLHHCAGEFYLIDLASTHGTYIGKHRLNPYTPTLVRKGSLIRFGAAMNQYLLSGFPSIEEIVNIAENFNSFESKALYVNTEYNRRLPLNINSSSEDLDESRIILERTNIQSHERKNLRRCGTFDLLEPDHIADQQNNSSSTMVKRENPLRENSCSISSNSPTTNKENITETDDVEISCYFQNFDHKLRKINISRNLSPSYSFKKRNHSTYSQSRVSSNDQVEDGSFTSNKRVRFQLLSSTLDVEGDLSSSAETSDD